MKIRTIIQIVSSVIILIGLFILLPFIISLIYQEEIALVILLSSLLTLTVGGLLYVLSHRKQKPGTIRAREGFAIVTFSWIAMAAFGALPFYLSSHITGHFVSYTDAFFESMSGFTTTGASILPSDFHKGVIANLPKGILFWRSLTQWIGGMGIILFSLAILSVLGIGGMTLYKAEVPGPIPDKLTTKVSSTAKLLWYVYFIISLMEFLALWLFGHGMNAFDAVCHTFTTMATGGFSTKDLSVGHFFYVGDPMAAYYEWVITFFMFVAGINFALHYLLLNGKVRAFFKDPEFRFYLFLTLIFIFFIGLNIELRHTQRYDDYSKLIRDSAFSVVSVLTTTGFGTADFNSWPHFSRVLLFLAMFIGGSAGSTGGGIKVIRLMILLKYSYFEILKLFHPNAAYTIRVGKQIIGVDVVRSIVSFFLLFIFIFTFSILLLSFLGLNFETALTAVVACIGNVGPGLDQVGPAENYAFMNNTSKWLLSFLMLLGRLEIYPVLVLLVPAFWRKY